MPIPLIAVLVAGLMVTAVGRADDGGGKRGGPGPAATGNLAQVEAALAGRPGDPALRFRKGLLLAERKRNAEAVAVFSSLARDFPESPEPYNNLAVLHAAAGRYEEARAMLDKAIRTSPAYAAVYDNLGGIHARLASQAYAKALGHDIGPREGGRALALVRDMQEHAGAAPPMPAMPSASGGAISRPAAASSIAAGPVQPAAVPPRRSPAAAPAADGGRGAVLGMVGGWVRGWGAREGPAYLAFYASDFELPPGMTRPEWEGQRHQRIAGKQRIAVSFTRPSVILRGDSATVQFRQTYRSDRFSARDRKTLVLVRQDGGWKIKKEWTGK